MGIRLFKVAGAMMAIVMVVLSCVFIDYLNFKSVAVPVLMYHGIGPATDKEWGNLLVAPELFEAHLKYLKNTGYRVVSVEELAERLSTNKDLKKYVAFTFDDGYENNYRYAYPLLKKYDFTATFYIIRNALGGEDYMNDGQIMAMLKDGMRFGSHTMSHSNLALIDKSQYVREIQGSKMLLEQRFDFNVESISYPYGAYNGDVLKEVVRARYKVGVAGKYGINTVDSFNDNPYIMNRVGIYTDCAEDANAFAHTLEKAYFVGYLRYRGMDVVEIKKFLKKHLTKRGKSTIIAKSLR